jgi:hypothetical protein
VTQKLPWPWEEKDLSSHIQAKHISPDSHMDTKKLPKPKLGQDLCGRNSSGGTKKISPKLFFE